MAAVTQNRPTLWQAWLRSKDSEENLTVDARRVIGILYSVYKPTPSLIAAAIQMPREDVLLLLKEIDKDHSFIVHKALASGLSLDATVDLPIGGQRVACKKCRQLLSAVPCCRCILTDVWQRKPIIKRKREKREKDRPQCNKPTRARPGSAEKIQVMAERAKAGFSVFCRGDNRIISKIGNHSSLPSRPREQPA
jgi:hypothetical protein